jgi:hypothetical protein
VRWRGFVSFRLITVALMMLSSACGCSPRATVRLDGFTVSRHWDEQIKEFAIEPGVRIHINAPCEVGLDPRRPTNLVLYALPNGNTIEWTIGRAKADGLDWHFYIQHIGAQTRYLREVTRDCNIVVAYIEADTRSWPLWRQKHENGSALIAGMLGDIKRQIPMPDTTVILSGHSGGGSFIFGYMNAFERIPDDIERITFLDSNYGFSVDEGHAVKLIEWLGRDADHTLVVLAYDDREIMFEGKKVVGPTGGTYRATRRMLDAFAEKLDLTESTLGDCVRWRGLDGRVDIIVHPNPDNRILHTALVGDMNGYIHAMATGPSSEGRPGVFGGPIAYAQWIQPD